MFYPSTGQAFRRPSLPQTKPSADQAFYRSSLPQTKPSANQAFCRPIFYKSSLKPTSVLSLWKGAL